MKKHFIVATILGLVLTSSLWADSIVEDTFDGSALDTNVWNSSGSGVSVSGGLLRTTNGGTVTSKASGTISNGALTVDFLNVSTSSWSVDSMELGLYSADGSNNVRIRQLGYGDYCSVYVQNGGDTYWYKLEGGASYPGVELRSSTPQSWRIEMDSDALRIYYMSSAASTWDLRFEAENGRFYPDSGRQSGTVNLPTEELFAKVVCNATVAEGDLRVSEITYTPEPAMALLFAAGIFGILKRKR